MESIITKYTKNCIICGRPTNHMHHCIEGTANRQMSENFGLKIPLCPDHHNLGNNSVHLQTEMNVMSHIIGQLAYERRFCAEKRGLPFEPLEEEARQSFREKFGKSYL